jgi:hypothetical protein
MLNVLEHPQLVFPLDCRPRHRVPPPSARWSSNEGVLLLPAGTAAIAGVDSRTPEHAPHASVRRDEFYFYIHTMHFFVSSKRVKF